MLPGSAGYFQSSFSITDFPDDARQGAYLSGEINSTDVNILDLINSSTNGMCEYTASNFDGALKGSLLSASFNGNIWRHVPSVNGGVLESKEILFNGFGSIPLDVIALPDDHSFAGTVWAVTYGASNITIFEPSDSNCIESTDPDFDPTADNDNDGYSNQDELDNNTNLCSAGSTPNDFDGDFISDLNDQDDDNDAILDVNDAFAIDANNGTTTNLPINYPFENGNPGTGFSGLGFTGLMLDPTGNTDYLTQFDEDNLDFGGATGKASINLVPDGDAYQESNSQQYAFQLGVNVDQNSNPFTIHSRVESPFFGIDGVATDPVRFQSAGIFIGNGDQDNYLKFVIGYGTEDTDIIDGVEVLLETNGIATSERYDVENLLDGNAVDFLINVNPELNEARPYISLDGGTTTIAIGAPITLPANFLDPTDAKGLAVGLISTSFTDLGSPTPFTAAWDFISITEDVSEMLAVAEEQLVFEEVVALSTPVEQTISVQNQSAPFDPAIEITAITISGPDSALFSTTATAPISVAPGTSSSIPVIFTPDQNPGVKNATIAIEHTGVDSPLIVPASATIIGQFAPSVRINAGSVAFAATDQGPDWLANDQKNSFSNDLYSVNTGNIGTFNLPYAQKHSSIPAYIDEATYAAIFAKERWDSAPGEEMEFTIPVANGNHIVNLYLGNGWGGASDEGARVYDIEIEGLILKDDLDLIAEFGGHKVGGMLSFPVTIFDEAISIRFIHEVQNPLINAIEILSPVVTEITDLQLTAIEDLTSDINETIDFAVAVSGGDPSKNYTYEIVGQPDGIIIEPTNGQISGVIAATAIDGGPAHDGVHLVTVTVSQEGLDPVDTQFTWTVLPTTPIAIVTPAEQTSVEGTTASLQIEATGSDTFQYSATGLPPLLTIDETTGLISGTINSQQNGTGAFIEENGLVVIEAESADVTGTGWSLEERNGATGIVAGNNHLNNRNGSKLSYDIQFNTPGIYRVQWRSDFSGSNQTDENDSWMKFVNDEDTWFFGQGCFNCGETFMANNLDGAQKTIRFPKGSNRITETTTPNGSGGQGWFKIYRTGSAGWNWKTYTSDSQSYSIYLRIVTPGVRTLQIGERSKGHLIDKIAIYKVDGPNYTDSELTALPQSIREGATNNPSGVYNVSVTAATETESVATDFIWNVIPEALPVDTWIDKDENENYVARHECSFVQAGESFIMFGGRESAKRLDVYDYTSDSWSQGGEAPLEFNHFQATTYKDLVWVIGAFKTNTFPNEAPADYIYMYNPATQEWIQGLEIPEDRRRGGAGLVVHNDKFYVIGGNTIGHNGGYVSWFDEYDPATGTWTVLPDAPHARDHFHAAISEGKLYAAGGRLSGGPGGTFAPVIPEVDVFDFTTGTWSVLANDLPTPRAGTSTVTFENEIYVIGGETLDQSSAYDTVEAYDPMSGLWNTKESLNHARHGTQAILSGEGIYIAGGSFKRGGGNQKNMEVYKSDVPAGTAIAASAFSTATTTVDFNYTDGQETVILDPIALTNSGGTTATFIKDISISGTGYTLSDTYTNILLDANSDLNLAVSFSETTLETSTGTITVTYDNDEEFLITLTGNLGLPPTEVVRYRVNVGGLAVPDTTMDWEQDLPQIVYGVGTKGDPSPYVNTDDDNRGYGSRRIYTSDNNSTEYPNPIFSTTRFSIYTAPRNQQWDFPVTNGDYIVNLLFAENWIGAKVPGIRVFDIYIENTIVAKDFDIVEAYGWATAGTVSYNVNVADGNLDIDFGKLVESPLVNGIEIIELAPTPEPIIIDPNPTGDNSTTFLSKETTPENVDQLLEENLVIYPVPASALVTLELKGETDDLIKDIEIRSSTTGIIVKQIENSNLSTVQVPVNDLMQGVYVAIITSANGGTTTKKISVF